MSESLYQPPTPQISAGRKPLAPDIHDALEGLRGAVFADAALADKTKHLLAVAVPNVTQCRNCITGKTKLARSKGRASKRSWRPSGSRRRCRRMARLHTPRWSFTRWIRSTPKLVPQLRMAGRHEPQQFRHPRSACCRRRELRNISAGPAPNAQRLPYSLRVLLENLVRNEDGRLVTGDQVRALAAWIPCGRAEPRSSSPLPGC